MPAVMSIYPTLYFKRNNVSGKEGTRSYQLLVPINTCKNIDISRPNMRMNNNDVECRPSDYTPEYHVD